jgi:CBS-domain-containing membrane protein
MLNYSESLTLGDVMRHIATAHERTCILQTEKGNLYGVISQGDLIKAIWNGAELISPKATFMNPNPIFIDSDEKDPDLRALLLFAEQGALLIPIIDKDKKIIKVLSVRKIISDKYGS